MIKHLQLRSYKQSLHVGKKNNISILCLIHRNEETEELYLLPRIILHNYCCLRSATQFNTIP